MAKPYFGGVTTDPEVTKLKAAYPEETLKPGVTIPYQDISRIINVPLNTYRYRTIVNRWRKMLSKTVNVYFKCVDATAYVVRDEYEKTDLSENEQASGVKKLRKSFVVGASVDITKLDESNRKRLEHIQGRNASFLALGRIKAKNNTPTLEANSNE